MNDTLPYGFVYETTNLINGKKYIGSHVRRKNRKKDPDDKWYLGSGKVIKKAIKKYGAENFNRTILEECYSFDELKASENRHLQENNCVNREDYYNLIPTYFGGTGKGIFSSVYGKHWSLSDEAKKNHSIAMKNANVDKRGEKNPAFGRKWFNDGKNTIFCLEKDAPAGFVLGSLNRSTSGKKWYTDGEHNLLLDNSEEIPCGYHEGQTKKNKAKKPKVIKEKKDRKGENAPFYGRKHTEETKEKIRIANTGKEKTPEHIAKLAFVKREEHRHWYTNGIDNLSLKKNELVPYGYHRGRTIKKRKEGDQN